MASEQKHDKYEPHAIEEKWQKQWHDNHIFEANPEPESDKEKYYLNVAYPYPSGAMHVGHGRTYTVPDVTARFKRMQGYNVLFPMAFHVTGTPVIGVSNRIARGDLSAIEMYRDLYKVPPDVLEKFGDPHEIVKFFSQQYQKIMNSLGYTIDWRRRFTTVDAAYSKFITWQYNKLHERGLVVTGEHPVKFCPNCDNPIGDHDLLDGEHASISEFILIKLPYKDGFIPAATLRPETIYGVTNMWIHPDATYVRARVNDEEWYISQEAADKLSHQGYDIQILETFTGDMLIGEKVTNPVTENKVEILPATFVNTSIATGMVMSVPAHAPFDYVALRDIQKTNPEYESIQSIPLIKIEGYGEIPAKGLVEEMAIKDQEDPLLRKATEQLYADEYSKGIMTMGYPGMSVKEAVETIWDELIATNRGSLMYEFSEQPVICRCNTNAIVKLLKDQWFLAYNNPDWKEMVKDCLHNMNIVPEETRAEFMRTIDWLREWACTRRVGLGTKLPWDDKWIVEPLSDSTIYMAYYTISRQLNSKKIDPSLLGDCVFNYIFLGVGDPERIQERHKVPVELLEEMRQEFLYWYPYDQRFSAKDLISNHLTFQLFHHTAVFPGTLWPMGMVVFGMGLLEGNKMSSSKGNIVLLEDAMNKYGADAIRMFLMGSAEPWQDFDWRAEQLKSTRRHVERFWNTCLAILDMEDGNENDLGPVDRWLLHILQKRIKATTEALESFQTRKALQEAYFGIDADLRWHRRRTSWDRDGAKWALKYVLHSWVRLLAPFIPHVCEELWSQCGDGFVSLAAYPVTDESWMDAALELEEEFVEGAYNDIGEILKVTGITPKKIVLYAAPEWKCHVLRAVMEAYSSGEIDSSGIIKRVMERPDMQPYGKTIPKLVQRFISDVRSMDPAKVSFFLQAPMHDLNVLIDAREFLESEFGCEINVYPADEAEYDPKGRSTQAVPMRPAIYVE